MLMVLLRQMLTLRPCLRKSLWSCLGAFAARKGHVGVCVRHPNRVAVACQRHIVLVSFFAEASASAECTLQHSLCPIT